MRFPSTARRVFLLAALAATATTPAAAQWRDARVAQHGELRLGAAGVFSLSDSRFGDPLAPGGAERAPLGPPVFSARISDDWFGPFATLRTRLNTFFDADPEDPFEIPEGGLALIANTFELTADRRIVPFDAELGLPARFSVGLRVPLVQNLLTPRGFGIAEGVVGWNPDTAWNRAALAAVDMQWEELGGAIFLPTSGSEAGQALQARAAAAGAEPLRLPESPVSWVGRTGVAGSDALFGGRFVGGRPQYELGDIEARVAFQVAGGRDPVPSGTARFDASVDLGVRFPTGLLSDAEFLVLPRPELGLTGIMGGARAELRGPRLGLAMAASLARLGDVDLVQRLWEGDPEGDLTPPPELATLRWSPGTRLSLEALPYVRPVEEIRVMLAYGFHRASEQYVLERTDVDGNPLEPVVADAAASAHRWGLGIDYSTRSRYVEGRSSIPMEAGVHFRETFAGSDGAAAERIVEMRLRLFFRLWGGGPS
jgi:hypothetical protein